MKTHAHILTVLSAVLAIACSNDSKDPNSANEENFPEVVADIVIDSEGSCSENSAIIDEQAYETIQTNLYEMVSAKIEEGCLALTVRHSGGCEEATLTLYDKGAVLESSPSKRLLRLAIADLDDCEKLVQRTEYFDLNEIKISYDTRIVLLIEGLEEEVLFEY